jgi:hypothetical protein
MNRALTLALLTLSLAMTSFQLPAEDEAQASPGLVLSTGIEGGGYWNAATRLQSVAQELGSEVEVRPSLGSLENLDRLVDPASPVNMAFAQADALQYFLDRNPGVANQVELLENIGQECVFVVTRAGHEVDSDEAMQAADGYKLGIASANSGVAITFNYMRSQVPELSDVEVKYGSAHTTLDALHEGDAGVDSIMLVHRPKELSPQVEGALGNPANFDFVEFGNDRLTRKMENDRRVYHPMNLAMPGPGEGDTIPVQTICVKGLLLINKTKLSEAQRDVLSELVVLHWMKVYVAE